MEASERIDKQKERKILFRIHNQVLSGIKYYREIILSSNGFSEQGVEDFNHHLDKAEFELEAMFKNVVNDGRIELKTLS